MQKRIIECVPNFSEGRNMEAVKQITDAIEAVKGVKLLDVDPGEATNRTVVTFVGEPEAVIEAAVAGVRRATEVIDMRWHRSDMTAIVTFCIAGIGITMGCNAGQCADIAICNRW